MPLIIGLFITTIDATMYFANRSFIQGVAHDGARTVAVMGGDGSAALSTPIEYKYGMTKAGTCGKVDTKGIAASAKKTTSTAIECNVMLGLEESRGITAVEIKGVVCTPDKVGAIGARTKCEIKWIYDGLPMSALSLLNLDANGDGNVTSGSSEAEVNLTGIDLVKRR